MKDCEACGKPHDGSFATGRFCSRSCARSFSTRGRRVKIREMALNAIKDLVPAGLENMSVSEASNLASESLDGLYAARKARRGKPAPSSCPPASVSFTDLGREMKKTILFRDQEGCCRRCGNSEWLGEPITLELEHKDGDNRNDERSNLELLCPNCHSYTKTWRGRNARRRDPISDDRMYEMLCLHGSIHRGLIALGMAPKGANYSRASRILADRGVALHGAQRRMTSEDVDQAIRMREMGMGYLAIGSLLGFNVNTVSINVKKRLVRAAGVEPAT